MLWIILFVVLFIWMALSRWKNRHIIKTLKNLKNDIRAFPVLGHGYIGFGNKEVVMSYIQLFGREANKHGGLTYIWSGNLYGVIVADPESLDVISKTCLEKHFVYKFTETVTGNGILTAPVPIWRVHRKIIVPTFRQQNLNQFVNRIFSRQGNIMADRLLEADGKGTFSIWKYINTYTFDSVFEAILGVQLKAQNNPDQPFLKIFDEGCGLVSARVFQPWLHSSAVYKLLPQYKTLKKNSRVLNDFVDQVIRDKRTQMETESKVKLGWNHENVAIGVDETRPKPLLELLLESSDGHQTLTDLECREEMMVLGLAGTDTSAVGAAFTAVMLSINPDVQEKVYQELREVFGDSDRPVEAEDLPRLKYLEAVIKETLRLYPPVPIIARTIEEDVKLPSGMTLHKGIGAFLLIWAVHRNPQYWGDDAEVFRPERFLDTPLKHPAAFIPFSFGPRNCPGYKYAMMSMTTLMATLIRRYQLLPATRSGTDTPSDTLYSRDKPLRVYYDIMMKDVDGFKLQIKSRI